MDNQVNPSNSLTDFEIAKLSRLFEILIRIDKRTSQQDELRTCNKNVQSYNEQ